MRSAAVNEAWEFYRDNCPGFKEPMRREFRRLDEYVSKLEETLGRYTCHVVREQVPMPDGGACEKWSCSECGGLLLMSTYSFATFGADMGRTGGGSGRYTSNYCPNCGKKIVDDCR